MTGRRGQPIRQIDAIGRMFKYYQKLRSSPISTPTRKTLVATLRDALRADIKTGRYQVGQRLPSEAKLTEEHSVSRTVVREAIAALRGDGLVEPRQGSGVYVIEPPAAIPAPFTKFDTFRLSSVIELLELRTAVEVEAASLAAQRRSPSQEENILNCLRAVNEANSDRNPSTETDFALHMAIAEATNNPRFVEFLKMLGPNSIPRRALDDTEPKPFPQDYIDRINSEHDRIVTAIVDRDAQAAGEAMRVHLQGSQERYRSLLRSNG